LERLGTFGKDIRDLHGLKIAAIGPKTAETWQDMGIIPDLVPDEYRAEAIIECFRKRTTISGAKILLPRAMEARKILPDELKKLGAQVDEIPIYQTVRPDQNANMLRQMLEEGSIDMVTFTSSSTVNNFMEMFTKDSDKLQEWLTGVAVACIGPVTADTANRRGISVDLIPETYTIEALSRAIVDYFSSAENLDSKNDR
jgi:uroporphyrinogen III methyltransferase/synthase